MSHAIALALLLAAAPHAPPPPAHRAAPVAGNLVRLITVDDYPHAALRNEEQGNVAVSLAVDAAGHVTSCTVTASSGSDSLDTTTCRLMIERARFTPARNAKGRAVPDTYDQKVGWRIRGENAPSASQAAYDTYTKCLVEAARPFAADPMSDDAVAEVAFARCHAEERALLGPGIPDTPPNREALRRAFRPTLLPAIHALRTR
jgi:TonB family protein